MATCSIPAVAASSSTSRISVGLRRPLRPESLVRRLLRVSSWRFGLPLPEKDRTRRPRGMRGSPDFSRRSLFAPLFPQLPHPRFLHPPNDRDDLVVRSPFARARRAGAVVRTRTRTRSRRRESSRGADSELLSDRARDAAPVRAVAGRFELGPEVVQRDDLLNDLEDDRLVDLERSEESDRIRALKGHRRSVQICRRRRSRTGRRHIDRASASPARDVARHGRSVGRGIRSEDLRGSRSGRV